MEIDGSSLSERRWQESARTITVRLEPDTTYEIYQDANLPIHQFTNSPISESHLWLPAFWKVQLAGLVRRRLRRRAGVPRRNRRLVRRIERLHRLPHLVHAVVEQIADQQVGH